ncbi:hypothetical protein J3E71DRAFT_178747 [Bipolaris maydis]|nr:hypothetical protein J3E71DRAFT_178747 [Bipolaris maydis]
MPPANPVHNLPIQFANTIVPNCDLSSALDIIKLQISEAIDYNNLKALIDALNYLKKDAQQKMSIRRASQASMQTHRQHTYIAGSLFITKDETESKSSNENYKTRSPTLYEENHAEHEIRNAAAETLVDYPSLLLVDNDSQADKILLERNCGTETTQLRHSMGENLSSPTSHTAGLFSNERDDYTDVQPAEETSATSLYQALEDLEDAEDQPFPELPYPSLAHQPTLGSIVQDVSDSLFNGGQFGGDILNSLPLPQFFNKAFEDLYPTSMHNKVQGDVEEIAVYPNEQYLTNQSHTENSDDNPTFQGYVDLAYHSGFRLPQETTKDTDYVNAQEILLPLVKDRPLTSRLLHSILYTLLPGPVLIIDLYSDAFDSEAVEGSTYTNLIAIVRRNEDASPLLIVGLERSKTEVFLPNLENFELKALRESLLYKPSEINRGRCLPTEQPIFDKLFHIHIYLDRQESQSHILVARNRYIKYCYFKTYLRAGISETLPPTPHTEEIHRVYENLTPSERKRRAPDMVKDEISKKIAKEYGGNEKRIRRNINKYIKDGRILHHILRGRRSLDPALLILFPSFGSDSPSLSMTEFGLELEELEEKVLMEAAWFGEVLQARPELLEPIPKAVLDIISNTLTYNLNLQGRDPDSFQTISCTFSLPDYYLNGEMKIEPKSNTSNEDAWPCLGAISIDRLNMLVFWESSWLSAREYHVLRQDGHHRWLVHARGEDELLISWEPTIERKSIQTSPQDLIYKFSIEVRRDRPGLLGYVAAKALPPSSNVRTRLPAFLAYWKIAQMTKGLFFYLQQTYSSHRGYIVHEESGKVWIQWEPTWVVYENLNESKKQQLLQISHDPEAILHRFHKAIVHYSMRSVVQRRIG